MEIDELGNPNFDVVLEMVERNNALRMSDEPMTITEKMRTVSAAEFGQRIAKAFNDSKSSTTIFLMQQAFTDCEDDNGIMWKEFEKMLKRITKEADELARHREALEQARDDLGKVIVYPWESEEEVEKHILAAQAEIDKLLTGPDAK